MGLSVEVRALVQQHLGPDDRSWGLRDAREFRSVAITTHRTGSSQWRWLGGSDASLTHCLILFPVDGLGVPLDGAAPPVRAVGALLPAVAGSKIPWRGRGDVLGVWVPTDALSDLSLPFEREPLALSDSTLTLALRAFAQSLARGSRSDSLISAYAIERLVAEMVFAMLLEHQGLQAADENQLPMVERANALILARREDPDFTSATMAAELHVSQRQLQRAFAAVGTTSAAELRRQRVQLAVGMLQDARYLPLTVEQVAQHSGFRSALQLRRALDAEGIATPQALRAAVNA